MPPCTSSLRVTDLPSSLYLINKGFNRTDVHIKISNICLGNLMDVEVDGVPFISPPPPHPGQGLALHYESSRDEVAVQNG